MLVRRRNCRTASSFTSGASILIPSRGTSHTQAVVHTRAAPMPLTMLDIHDFRIVGNSAKLMTTGTLQPSGSFPCSASMNSPIDRVWRNPTKTEPGYRSTLRSPQKRRHIAQNGPYSTEKLQEPCENRLISPKSAIPAPLYDSPKHSQRKSPEPFFA